MTATPSGLTVQSVSDRAANFLVTVPPVGFEVCEVCHGPVDPSFATCFGCKSGRDAFGSERADAVAAVTIAPRGSQIARHLAFYKDVRTDGAQRNDMMITLAGSLWRWLNRHEVCLAQMAGVRDGRFDVVTTIPSTSGRTGRHPLDIVVSAIVQGSGDRCVSGLLAVDNVSVGQRSFEPDRYTAMSSLRGSTVLVVDDTWTTGAHAQSASVALKRAGAARVAVLAIGRWVTPEFRDNAGWLQRHRAAFSWENCCLYAH